MPKQIEVTPKIAAALKKATDGAVEASSVAVFETISLNTLPIKQRGIFNGAVVSQNTLNQMAASVDNGANVPLHKMHDQGSDLPVGKTFFAESIINDRGLPELRSLFYLPLTETDLITKLETDVISEVSVGLKTLHINCSECGWDYLGEDSSFMNLYDTTCANDHVIGKDGVHVLLNGLDRWMEQSLVSLGAANGARIQSRTKALLGTDRYEKLAASGITPEITVLNAVHSMKEETNMDMAVLIAGLTDAKASVINLTAEVATGKTALEATKAELTTALAEVVTLKAKVTPEAAALQLSLTAAQAETEKARASMHKEASRLAVALALTAPVADATMDVLLASIEENRTKMAAAFPAGGAQPKGSTAVAAAPSSFKGA